MDATVRLVVKGANDEVVINEELTTGVDGRATILMLRYTAVGGYGTYTIEATATKGPKSSTQTKTFEVMSRIRGF
jgi:hypothetical protein